MKPESEDGGPLRRALRDWRVTDPLPPRFQEGVWRRIQQAEADAPPASTASLWAMSVAWVSTALRRPALALAYISLLLLLGVAGGLWQARRMTGRLDDDMSRRYVQSVDPYQKPSRI